MSENKIEKNNKKKTGISPIWFIIGIGVILIAAAVILLNKPRTQGYTPEVSGAPKLKILRIAGGANAEVDGENVDFGDVPVGEPVKVTYTLANVGDEPLEFKEPPWIEVLEGC